MDRNWLRKALKAREAMDAAVRSFFQGRGFTEISTPLATPFPNLDPNIRPLPVDIRDPAGRPARFWLHTSPEPSMKRLLAEGSGNIFQICRVFRDEEMSAQHRSEFTMLEWYMVDADYREAIRDTMDLVRSACRAVRGEEIIRWAGASFDLAPPWEVLTLSEAFRRYAGVDSFGRGDLADALESLGYRCAQSDRHEDLFFRLYLEKVEPELGRVRPTVVTDYPDFLGTMARPKADTPSLLERFEVFIGGVELANGYSELTDGDILRTRLEKVAKDLEREGVEGLAVDEDLLDAVSRMPDCTGVSLGMDRLAMLILGAEDIGQVVYPFTGAAT